MTISDKFKQRLRRTYPSTITPQFVDNKEVMLAHPNPDAGKTCNSCWFYHLQVELKADDKPPDYTPIELDEDKKPYRSWEPDVRGFCVYYHPLVITEIPLNYGCELYLEKAKELQFQDDIIKEEFKL